jgi:CRP-like cAMP-binding protein
MGAIPLTAFAVNGSTVALLAQLPMFARTPRHQLAELARQSLTAHAAPGSLLARRGERLPGLMVVRYGLLKLSMRGEGEKVLRLVGPGGSFGEIGLFVDEPLPFDVAALADTSLVVVPSAPLLELFDGDRRFARSIVAAVCHRLHGLIVDFEAATVHGARERLAAYIDSLAPPEGAPAIAHLHAAKGVVAARLGMTKETLSRLLRAFMDEGLIAVARRDIELLDRVRLRGVAVPASAGSRG